MKMIFHRKDEFACLTVVHSKNTSWMYTIELTTTNVNSFHFPHYIMLGFFRSIFISLAGCHFCIATMHKMIFNKSRLIKCMEHATVLIRYMLSKHLAEEKTDTSSTISKAIYYNLTDEYSFSGKSNRRQINFF